MHDSPEQVQCAVLCYGYTLDLDGNTGVAEAAGRWGTPTDLKGAVVFLSSPAAAYVHGTTLAVDGGWLSR